MAYTEGEVRFRVTEKLYRLQPLIEYQNSRNEIYIYEFEFPH